MRRIKSVLLTVWMFLPLPVFGQEPPDVARLQKGMPHSVANLISRIVDCNHWQGEEPYDSDRAAEIARAVSRLRCGSLDEDEAAALASFGKVDGVRHAIAAAKEI